MLYSKSFVCFEGDDDKDNKDEKDEKKFNQDDVNTILAKEKRRTQDVQKRLAEQLETAKKDAALSDDERNELSKQVDELQTKYMTVEELSKQAADKAKGQHDHAVKDLTTERDAWKQRYTTAMIDIEITQASIANKAVAAEQIAAMLRPTTRLTEKLGEDNKPNGLFESRVAFSDTDKDGKAITLDLTVADAVKRMSELPVHGNLFVNGKASGLGGSGNSGKRTDDTQLLEKAKNDPALYRKLRKERPELFAAM